MIAHLYFFFGRKRGFFLGGWYGLGWDGEVGGWWVGRMG